ncbi:peptidylprolyl isomerase [Echinicola sediminis]
MACSPHSKVSQDALVQDTATYLVKIGNEDVPADEFLHMLSKDRDFDEEEQKLSPEEFEDNFNLFINYKLKVKEAEALGMHESEEFRREFQTFKEDLKKPYLLENSLQEGELRKAYSRMQEVVHAKHILLRFPPKSTREDSIAVFRMAQNIREKAETGTPFEELALEYSQDPSVENNNGDLGYFTSLQMVYPFEDAVYNLQTGQISEPVLTSFGYHLIQLVDRKPNPGQIKVSHILVRTDPTDPISTDRARRKIADIYTELQKESTSWDEVCSAYSEDEATKNSGGELPWFGVGAFIKEFENVAFSLKEAGEISSPVKSPYGYHIIRLEDTKPLPPYEEMEKSLKSKILRDSRSQLIQSQALAILKSKYSFSENDPIIQETGTVLNEQPQALLDAKNKLENKNLLDSTLFEITTGPKTVKELIAFIERDEAVVKTKPGNFYRPWLNAFIAASLNEAEENDLTANNEEYRLLIKEYRDGILLFNLMNEMVWQKALLDSAGQQEFYENNQSDYMWEPRAEALIVKINSSQLSPKTEAFLKDKAYGPGLKPEVERLFEDQSPIDYQVSQGVYEYKQHPVLKSLTNLEKNFQKTTYEGKPYFIVLGKKFPKGPKAFNETKGKVIQDYQESLDKELIGLLKKNYIIHVNEDEKNRIANIVVNQN